MSLTTLFAAAVLGCSSGPAPSSVRSPSPQTWQVEVEAQGEGTMTRLTVRDLSGAVAGLRPGQPGRAGVKSLSLGAELAHGSDRDVIVSWTGTRCSHLAEMTIQRVNELVVIAAHAPSVEDCDPMAVTYGAVVSMSEAVDLGRLVVRDDSPPHSSFGVMLTGTDGRLRNLVVIDETRQVTLVAPIVPEGLPAVRSDIVGTLSGEGDQAEVAWPSQECHDTMALSLSGDGNALLVTVELARSANAPGCATSHAQGLVVDFDRRPPWESVRASLKP